MQFKHAQGLSELTVWDYESHVQQFYQRYPETNNAWSNLEENLFQYLSDNKIKPSTYNNRLVYLSAFYNWCVEQQIIADNPIKKLRKRKTEGRIVSIHEGVLQQLLCLPDRTTFSGIRDFVLILLSLDTGIRPKEALSLSVEDVNLFSF